MDDKKVTIRISEELFKQFRIALITRGETAQAVLEKAVKNYLNPKEGNEMENCPVCHTPYQAETGIQVGSKVVCQSCFENYSRTCTDCGEYFFPHGDESRCRKCSGVRRNNAI